MDRPSQKPPERPGPPSEAGESPLSFPVEAPKLADVEPGAGEPLSFPAEAGSSPADSLSFPAELAPAFPAEAAPAPSPVPAEANPLQFPAAATAAHADPLAFPAPPLPSTDPRAQAAQPFQPVEQLPFPVAQLPGAVTTPPPAPPAPPAEPAPAAEAPSPAPSGLLRFLPAVLTAVAALMTAFGCFLPLFRLQQHVSVRQRFFEARLTVTETAWGSRVEIPGQDAVDQGASPVGIPLILAVIVLAVAAFAALSRPGRGAGRWLIGAGALFTAGVVTTVGMSGLGWSAMADSMDLEVVTAAGMWLLIGATVLAAVAAVLAYLPAWRRTGDDWADPALAYADTPTPPSGVAITVLPPEEPGQPGQPG
ncbi:hypothetical protein AB0C38_21310 [Amycolatopsis sp. NPDC048633]|uniref:hypothetical protein n=1 Tax=Amycolatopsis sp. NPDC048633 TaxID=3157095 RepID=UPI0033E7B30C